MELAVNYSPQLLRLLDSGKVRADLIKCPDWPDLVAETVRAGRPCYVHFDLRLGEGTLARADWGKIDSLREQTQTRCINAHIRPMASALPGLDPAAEDAAAARRVSEVLYREAAELAERFGPENVVVENVYCFPHAHDCFLRCGMRSELIGELVEKVGCGFLLDLAHARIAARQQGLGEREYVASLPVGRLREMHVTGVELLNGHLTDHQPLAENDWAEVRWAAGQIASGAWSRPDIVTFEYGGVGADYPWPAKEEILAEQVPRLYDLCHEPDCRGSP